MQPKHTNIKTTIKSIPSLICLMLPAIVGCSESPSIPEWNGYELQQVAYRGLPGDQLSFEEPVAAESRRQVVSAPQTRWFAEKPVTTKTPQQTLSVAQTPRTTTGSNMAVKRCSCCKWERQSWRRHGRQGQPPPFFVRR